jgi:hypothetical protein
VREWLESKLKDEAEVEPRCTNHYLCLRDSTRWNSAWSSRANDRCPTCGAETESFATTNSDEIVAIHNQEVYEGANVVGR